MKNNLKKIGFMALVVLLMILTACGNNSQQSSGGSSSPSPTPSDTASSQPEPPKTDFPTKDIELVVPYSAGGTSDIIARTVAKTVQQELGKSVIIVNKPGAGAALGTTDVYNAKPDGYTLLMTTTSPITIKPHDGSTAYTWNSLTPIMQVAYVPQVLMVRADSPWQTFEDWLQYVKENPGKFTYAVSGIGSTGHLVMEQLNKLAGIATKVVPYDGSGDVMAALLGGNVDGAIAGTADVDMGKVRGLFTFGGKSEVFKDAPTLQEKGIDEYINLTIGLFGPPDLPRDVFDIIHDAFKKALEDEEVLQSLKEAGIVPAYVGPDEFAKYLEQEFNIFGELYTKVNG